MNFVEEIAGYTMAQSKFELNDKIGCKSSPKEPSSVRKWQPEGSKQEEDEAEEKSQFQNTYGGHAFPYPPRA